MTNITQAIQQRNIRVAARLMRDLDDRQPAALQALKDLYPLTGNAVIVGITGPPGSGKSTLVDALIAVLRASQRRVAVVAVDPSSPFTGGAILGDRIRMNRHALDEGVFIRSLASRGHLGGLSRSTNDTVTVLDAMGYDIVIIETVGVGQGEIDIVEAAHISIVVAIPGLGDEVQAIKAGILEIADILCLNKADREGADRTVHDLELMLGLRDPSLPHPPILRTIASSGVGVKELAGAMDELTGHRTDGPGLQKWQQRQVRRARRQLEDLVREGATATALAKAGDKLDDLIDAVAKRQLDPYSLAEQLVKGIVP